MPPPRRAHMRRKISCGTTKVWRGRPFAVLCVMHVRIAAVQERLLRHDVSLPLHQCKHLQSATVHIIL